MRTVLLLIFSSFLANIADADIYFDMGSKTINDRVYTFRFDRATWFIFDVRGTVTGDFLVIGSASIRRVNALKLQLYYPGGKKSIRYTEGGDYSINADCSGGFACYGDLGISAGVEVRVKVWNLKTLRIGYTTSECTDRSLTVYNSLKTKFTFDKQLILDSSKCNTQRYSLQKVEASKIGMSLDCFANYQVVKAKVTVTTEDDKEYSYLIKLTPTGPKDFGTEVEVYSNPVFDVPPPVMPYDIERELVNDYAVVDVQWSVSENSFGLLLGYKSYMHFIPYKAISIETVAIQGSDVCPVVLLIPDDFESQYDSTCTEIPDPIDEFPEWWKPFHWDDYHILFIPNKVSRTFRFETNDEQFRFLVATEERGTKANRPHYRFSIGSYNVTISNPVGSSIDINDKHVDKIYGKWAGWDLIPVVLTQDYCLFGSKAVRFNRRPQQQKLSEMTFQIDAQAFIPIIFMPKKYSTEDNLDDLLQMPRTKFEFIPDYHYLQPRLCNESSEYTVSTEDSLFLFFGIPDRCFNKAEIISGSIMDSEFSIVRSSKQIELKYAGLQVTIFPADLQKRLGLTMIPMTFYSEYLYIGTNLHLYNLTKADNLKFTKVKLAEEENSCSFMFILPKNETQLADSLECGIPPEWRFPTSESDPNEQMYWMIGGAVLVLLTVLHIILTCWSLRCCERKPKNKQA